MADADRPTDHSLSLVNDTEGNNVIHKHELPPLVQTRREELAGL